MPDGRLLVAELRRVRRGGETVYVGDFGKLELLVAKAPAEDPEGPALLVYLGPRQEAGEAPSAASAPAPRTFDGRSRHRPGGRPPAKHEELEFRDGQLRRPRGGR